jgi:hypothetical protein
MELKNVIEFGVRHMQLYTYIWTSRYIKKVLKSTYDTYSSLSIPHVGYSPAAIKKSAGLNYSRHNFNGNAQYFLTWNA